MKYKDLNETTGRDAMLANGTLAQLEKTCQKYSGETLKRELKYQRWTHTAIIPNVKESTVKKWLSDLYKRDKQSAQQFLDNYNYHMACIAEIDLRIAAIS